jgi:glycosyltransferase involved in cell wall biosynthesis
VAIKVGQIELTRPLEAVRGTAPYEGVRILVRHAGEPLGWLLVANSARDDQISPAKLREEVLAPFPWDLTKRALGGRFRPARLAPNGPRCSVVICAEAGAALSSPCLSALSEQDYQAYEILVVDRAPPGDSTKALTADLPVRHVHESRPGLAWPRNRGLLEAKGDVVVFLAGDSRPDPGWLRAIARTFVDAEVAVVIGSAASDELETAEQELFELSLGGRPRPMDRRTVRQADLARGEPLRSIWPEAGASLAVRRAVFAQESGFDPAADVGHACGSTAELELCQRLIAQGRTLVYEPAALVWRTPPRSFSSLKLLARSGGEALGAYVLVSLRGRRVGGVGIVRFALRRWLWKRILRRLLRPGGLPRSIVWAELLGVVGSPLALLAARRRARTLGGASSQDGRRQGLLWEGEGARV